MNQLIRRLLAGPMLFAATIAHAETMDMATISCREFTAMPIERVVVIGSWMSGYFNAKANNTVLDLDRMDEVGAAIGKFCEDHSDIALMKAIEELMSRAK